MRRVIERARRWKGRLVRWLLAPLVRAEIERRRRPASNWRVRRLAASMAGSIAARMCAERLASEQRPLQIDLSHMTTEELARAVCQRGRSVVVLFRIEEGDTEKGWPQRNYMMWAKGDRQEVREVLEEGLEIIKPGSGPLTEGGAS